MMAYAIGLNNDIGEFLLDNNLTGSNLARKPFLSIIILVLFFGILKFGGKTLIKAIGILSFVLIVVLFSISIMLIEMWDFEGLFEFPSLYDFIKQMFLLLPVLLMSFIFFSTVSPMVVSFREHSKTTEELEQRSAKVLKNTTAILMIFVLLFVYSCIFALSAEEMKIADAKNISVLALLGSVADKPFLKEFGPVISIIALTTSFFGTALGLRSSTIELFKRFFKDRRSKKALRVSEIIFYSFSLLFLWMIAILNMNIIKLIGMIIAPLVALILYFIPIIILFRIPQFKPYRNVGSVVIFIAGVLFFAAFYVGKLM
jgi:serine transporter